MPPKLPPKTPQQVWDDHQRRITAAEGVPTFLQVLSHDAPDEPTRHHLPIYKEHELTPKTSVRLPVAAWGSIILVIFVFGTSLGLKGGRILDQQDSNAIALTKTLKKQDLLDAKREIAKAFILQVQRGEIFADCPTLFKRGALTHRCVLGGLVLPDFPPLPPEEK